MRNITFTLLIVTSLFFTCPPAYAESQILDLSSGNIISFFEMIDELGKADIVFLGDDITGDNHQISKIEIIKALYDKNKNTAVGVETFRSENQYVLDQWINGEISKRRFVDVFDQNWGNWNIYSKFFEFLRDKKIKLVGLNISRDILAQVESEGFNSLSTEQLGGLQGITCNIQPGYQELMRRTRLYKGILKNQAFQNFCEMKILGDITMARNLKKFHNNNPDLKTIVVAGNIHTWKHGIPKHLKKQIEVNTKIVFFEAEGHVTRNTITTAEADYLWLDYGPSGWIP